MSSKYDGLQEIMDEALRSMAAEAEGRFDPLTCNLSELRGRTGLSRQRARTIKANRFEAKPHGRFGTKAAKTVISGYTGFVDDQLRKGVTNSQVCVLSSVFEPLTVSLFEPVSVTRFPCPGILSPVTKPSRHREASRLALGP